MNEISIQKYGCFDAATEASGDKLFSAGQVFAAGLFGSIFTGQFMLALNYAKLGDAKRAITFPKFFCSDWVNSSFPRRAEDGTNSERRRFPTS